MLDEKKSTLHFGARSLLPLQLALRAAEKESPSRAPQRQVDPDEELALQLIKKVKKEYGKIHVFANHVIARSERQ